MATSFEANKDDLKPFSYGTQEDSPHVKAVIEKLGMTKHPEGGFYVVSTHNLNQPIPPQI